MRHSQTSTKQGHQLIQWFSTSGPFMHCPQHCQDSDQANTPVPSPLQATHTRRTEPHHHYESH